MHSRARGSCGVVIFQRTTSLEGGADLFGYGQGGDLELALEEPIARCPRCRM